MSRTNITDMSSKTEKSVKETVHRSDSVEMRRMALLETVRREGLSYTLFPLLWSIIGVAGGVHRSYPLFVYANVALSLAVAVFRLWLRSRLETMAVDYLRGARRRVFGSIALTAFHWGFAASLSILVPGLRSIESSLMVCATAIIAIGTFAFGINRFLRYAIPACGLVPISIALILTPQVQGNLVLGAVLSLFVVHIVFTAGYIESDYWTKLHTQFELQTMSTTDALTGVRNRKFFNDRLADSHALAERARQPLAIALIDLDHFKQVNDQYGHPTGDLCLQRAASALAGIVQRSGDVLARYGGEEFIVMMPNTDLAGAQVIAERLLSAIRAVDLVVNEVKVPVTCSIGIASAIPDRSTTSSALIKAADDALYEAKRSGRNRIVAAQPSTMSEPAK